MEKPNLNYIKQLSDGDIDFENQILSVLKRELPEEFEEFLKNFIKTAENVHKIKHKISILGLTKGYEEAALFENDLRDRRETKRYDSFVEIIKSMLDFLSPTKI